MIFLERIYMGAFVASYKYFKFHLVLMFKPISLDMLISYHKFNLEQIWREVSEW